jgi:hypothetical protein
MRLLICIFVLLVALPAAAAAQQPDFGVVTHDLDEQRAAKMTELGAGFARISFRWWQLEPEPGRYEWGSVDDYIWQRAQPRGIRLFVSLGEPPEWAGGGPDHNGTPSNLQDWYNFVFAAVSRYRGYVRHWGIWNEPNLTQFLDNRDNYEAIVAWARLAIRAADPTALVLGPEVSEHALDDGWFAQVMSTFGRDAFDIVTMHYYTGSLTARMDSQVYPWRYGKEVWVTETGRETISGLLAFELLQRGFYASLLQAFEPRRWWWTKVFFYDIWAWDYGYRFGLCGPDWQNHLAFDFYRDWIAARPERALDADLDADGLPDRWEGPLGLDVTSAAGANGSAGDPDGDGVSNRDELGAGTHPRGFWRRLLAEGASTGFFTTRIAVANPGSSDADVLLRFSTQDGRVLTHAMTIPRLSTQVVAADDVPGLHPSEFSTAIEADVPVIVDRRMTWDADGFGSSSEAAVAAPSAMWFMAEGATHSGFDLFYLLQNPGTATVQADVTYLLPAPGAPIVRRHVLPPSSRTTIWVNREDARLAATDVSAAIVADGPIVVERAMYRAAGGRAFGAGHSSAAVPAAATEWFLAEGATGAYFDTFLLIANPTTSPADVDVTYALPDGSTITRRYGIAGQSRYSVWVDYEDARLADTAVASLVASTNGVPIVVERAMWWPGPTPANWLEAHSSVGAVASTFAWGVADGEVGGAANAETYLLIANTAVRSGSARVTLLFADGRSLSQTFTLPPSSRTNVDVRSAFPGAAGRTFGATVTSIGSDPVPIVVERAIYTDAAGVRWAAGASAPATRLN